MPYEMRCPKADYRDWANAPQALGMTVVDGQLVGTWNGRVPIRVAHQMANTETYEREAWEAGTPAGSNGYYYHTTSSYSTLFQALLDPTLSMGLSAQQKTRDRRNRTGFDLGLGEQLERHFDLVCVDPEHARRVLGGPVLAEILRDADVPPAQPRPGSCYAWTRNLVITDGKVTATTVVEDYVVDPDVLRAGIETVGRIAEAVLDQRARELAPWESAVGNAWPPIASGWNLTLESPLAGMSGEMRGLRIHVRVTAAPSPPRLWTETRVRFARPLGCQLSLSRQNAPAGFFKRVFGGQDIVVGDRAFDEAFVVKGAPENAVRAVLSPKARQRLLLVLSRFSAMSVDNDVLTVWEPDVVTAPERLDDLLKCAFAAAEALA